MSFYYLNEWSGTKLVNTIFVKTAALELNSNAGGGLAVLTNMVFTHFVSDQSLRL